MIQLQSCDTLLPWAACKLVVPCRQLGPPIAVLAAVATQAAAAACMLVLVHMEETMCRSRM